MSGGSRSLPAREPSPRGGISGPEECRFGSVPPRIPPMPRIWQNLSRQDRPRAGGGG